MRIGLGQLNNFNMGSVLGKRSGISLPNFGKFEYNTKTPLPIHESKFKDVIARQAKKDQAEGNFHSSASRNLQKQYVSSVSPDRKGIITAGLNQITNFNKCNKLAQSGATNIKEFALELIFGMVIYKSTADKSDYAEFKDEDGNLVARYSNGKWDFVGTDKEFARETEFMHIYNDAWGAAKSAAAK